MYLQNMRLELVGLLIVFNQYSLPCVIIDACKTNCSLASCSININLSSKKRISRPKKLVKWFNHSMSNPIDTP